MRIFCAIFAPLLGVGISGAALAQGTLGLTVVRAASAGSCPTELEVVATLTALGARLRPEPGLQLEFTREPDGFNATISVRSTGTSRVLRAKGDSCAPLAQAAALALVLLLDSAPETASAPKTASTPSADGGRADGNSSSRSATHGNLAPNAPSEAPKQAKTLPQAAPQAHLVQAAPAAGADGPGAARAQLSAGPAALVGVVRPLVPAATVEIALEIQRLRVALAGLLSLPSVQSLGPGTVRSGLWGGAVNACVQLAPVAPLKLDACSGFYLAAHQASASGFTTNQRATRLWAALPVGLALRSAVAGLGFHLSASALLPLLRNEFTVAGQGGAYRAPAVGALFTLQASFSSGP